MQKRKLEPPSRTDNLRVVALRLPGPIIALIDRIGHRQIQSAVGVVLALVLVIAGMVLPHLRPMAHCAERPRAEPGCLQR